jgi:hypothetical protein
MGLPQQTPTLLYPGDALDHDGSCIGCGRDVMGTRDPNHLSVGAHVRVCLHKMACKRHQEDLDDAFEPQQCPCEDETVFTTRPRYARHVSEHVKKCAECPMFDDDGTACSTSFEDMTTREIRAHFALVHLANASVKPEVNYCYECNEMCVSKLRLPCACLMFSGFQLRRRGRKLLGMGCASTGSLRGPLWQVRGSVS